MGLFARIFSGLAGVAVFVLALLAGGFLLVIFVGLALAVAAVFAVRLWWWKRKVGPINVDIDGAPRSNKATSHETLEGDYRVIDD